MLAKSADSPGLTCAGRRAPAGRQQASAGALTSHETFLHKASLRNLPPDATCFFSPLAHPIPVFMHRYYRSRKENLARGVLESWLADMYTRSLGKSAAGVFAPGIKSRSRWEQAYFVKEAGWASGGGALA